MVTARHRRIVRRAVFAIGGGVLVVIAGCKPPPDQDKAVDAIRESVTRGASAAEEAVKTVQDPEKRQRAVDQIKHDLNNAPRQFK